MLIKKTISPICKKFRHAGGTKIANRFKNAGVSVTWIVSIFAGQLLTQAQDYPTNDILEPSMQTAVPRTSTEQTGNSTVASTTDLPSDLISAAGDTISMGPMSREISDSDPLRAVVHELALRVTRLEERQQDLNLERASIQQSLNELVDLNRRMDADRRVEFEAFTRNLKHDIRKLSSLVDQLADQIPSNQNLPGSLPTEIDQKIDTDEPQNQ